jgi:colanic acid/amylovoran biosynthesis glycosyltransferase
MVHVAHLVNSFPARSETFIIAQLKGLLQREVSITLCPRFNYEDGRQIEHLYQYPHFTVGMPGVAPRGNAIDSLHSFAQVMGAGKALIPMARAWLSPGPGGFRRGMPRLHKCLDTIKPDIIHCQFGTLSQSVARLKELKLISAPIIVSIRGWDISQALQRRGPDFYRRPIRQQAFFLPVCNYFASRLIKLGCPERRIRVLRSGLVLKNFNYSPRWGDPTDAVHIVCIGRFVEKKGLSDAIEALALLLQDGRRARMTLVGWGPLEGDLQKKVAEKGLKDCVSFVGSKSHHEAIQIMRTADVFVAPSVTAPDGDEEGIPNVLKESMAIGVPVISTRHSGIPELIEHGVTGLLVNQRSPTEIARAVIELSEMSAVRRHCLCKAARNLIEKEYDSEAIVNQLLKIYTEILEVEAPLRSGGSGIRTGN